MKVTLVKMLSGENEIVTDYQYSRLSGVYAYLKGSGDVVKIVKCCSPCGSIPEVLKSFFPFFRNSEMPGKSVCLLLQFKS